MAILTRYLPEGYTIEGTDCIIRDGYVYVSVKKDVEIREAVLHITFETPNGEVVTTETVTAEGADGEDAVFRLGVVLQSSNRIQAVQRQRSGNRNHNSIWIHRRTYNGCRKR